MTTSTRFRRVSTAAALVAALTLSLAACTTDEATGDAPNDGIVSEIQSELYTQIQEAVGEAVPDATEVAVTTLTTDDGDILGIRLKVDDPEVATADNLDSALDAAWNTSDKTAGFVEVIFEHEFMPVNISALTEELDITPATNDPTGVVVDAAQLDERYSVAE